MFLETACFLTDNLMHRFCRDDGLLAARADCAAGHPASKDALVDEFGDYVQYVALLGKLENKDHYRHWALKQVVDGSAASRTDDGLMYPQFTGYRKPFIRFFPLIRIGDTLWGLSEMYRLEGDSRIKTIYDDLLETILAKSSMGGLPTYGSLCMGNLALPLPLSEPMTTGYLVDSMLVMYEVTGERGYLDKSNAILTLWISRPSFERHGLFLRCCHTLLEPVLSSLFHLGFTMRKRPGMGANIMVKGDTYLIFALIHLAHLTGDDRFRRIVFHWRDAVAKHLVAEDGRFFNSYDTCTGEQSSIALEENHSVIEALLDISFVFQDDLSLDLARRCADRWLELRHPSELIANRDGDDWAEIDPLLDFAINLLKIAELCKDVSYQEKAFAIFGKMLKYFRLPYGFGWKAGLNASPSPLHPVVESKYLGLFIKGLLVFDVVEQGGTIFSNPDMRLLTADR